MDDQRLQFGVFHDKITNLLQTLKFDDFFFKTQF